MCVQYWPALVDKEETYGGIHVTVLKEEQLANFVIRSIRLRHGTEVRDCRSGCLFYVNALLVAIYQPENLRRLPAKRHKLRAIYSSDLFGLVLTFG